MRPFRLLSTLIALLVTLQTPVFAASVSPLVIVAGRVQTIPAGDALMLPAAASDGTLILTQGSAPGGTPTNGALWTTSAGLFARINGATVGPFGTGSGTCTPSGAQYQVLVVNAAGTACDADANASLQAGALTLGASGIAGSVTMGNATSGTIVLAPVTGALGSVTASLPAHTGTLAETNLLQTWNAAQTFANGDLKILSGGGGVTTLDIPTTGSNSAIIIPQATADTVVLQAATQSLSNKTLASPNISGSPTVSPAWSVANGGTNCAAASGTCLDNITAFSGTGVVERTGAGAYSFVPIGTSGADLPLLNGVNTWSGLQTDTADHAVSGAAGTFRHYYLQTAGVCRWGWQEDSTAEGGANAGSNLELIACNDAGSVISNPIVVTRSTGLVSVGAGLQLPRTIVASLPACGATTAGTLYTVTDATAPTWHSTLVGGGAVFSGAMCTASVWQAF